jgi:hypothetical protein
MEASGAQLVRHVNHEVFADALHPLDFGALALELFDGFAQFLRGLAGVSQHRGEAPGKRARQQGGQHRSRHKGHRHAPEDAGVQEFQARQRQQKHTHHAGHQFAENSAGQTASSKR